MINLSSGTILIADPFLKDPNFRRSVVFLCEHQQEGSFGFIMNRLYHQPVSNLIDDLAGCGFPVYYGGPVQLDTVHFLHQCPQIIQGGTEITDGIFWGGDFEQIVELIQNKIILPSMLRFYIGYSGWTEGQLAGEVKEKSWLTTKGCKKLVFHGDTHKVWPDAIRELGSDYEQLINYPLDPQLN